MPHDFYKLEFKWNVFGVEKVIVSMNSETGIGKIIADIEEKSDEEVILRSKEILVTGYSKSRNINRVYSTTPKVGLYPILLPQGVYLKEIKNITSIPHEKIAEMGLRI